MSRTEFSNISNLRRAPKFFEMLIIFRYRKMVKDTASLIVDD
jgi:hypothetical protein